MRVRFGVSAQIIGGLAAAGIIASVLGAASAAEPQRGALAACATDLATFCPGAEAGGGKKMRCLIDNRAKVSPACSTSIDARISQRAARVGGVDVAPATPPGAVAGTLPPAARAAEPVQAPIRANMRACRTAMATFCSTVEKGGGGKLKCLIDNKAKVSPECAGVIDRVQSQRQAGKGACQVDAAKLCGDARGPARRLCLESNAAQLSPACGEMLAQRAAKQDKRAAAPPK
jgi:hypothetical protein